MTCIHDQLIILSLRRLSSRLPALIHLTMKIAVVGGGVSGLSATWALNEHSRHEVHLFESGDYVGGHTNTVLFRKPGEKAKEVMVDT